MVCIERRPKVTGIRERSVVDVMTKIEWGKNEAYLLRMGNGAGFNTPHPFIIIKIWAGVMLAKDCRSTVSGAQVNSSISVMRPC